MRAKHPPQILDGVDRVSWSEYIITKFSLTPSTNFTVQN